MMPEALPPQQVPPAVYALLEGLLLDRAIAWGEGCRARTLARRRGREDAAAWLEAHPAEVATGWQAGFLAAPGSEPLTRNSLQTRLLARGPIILDEVPVPGLVPVEIVRETSPKAAAKKKPLPPIAPTTQWF